MTPQARRRTRVAVEKEQRVTQLMNCINELISAVDEFPVGTMSWAEYALHCTRFKDEEGKEMALETFEARLREQDHPEET
jgi:hypothetical protein